MVGPQSWGGPKMIRGWQDTHASQTHSRVLATHTLHCAMRAITSKRLPCDRLSRRQPSVGLAQDSLDEPHKFVMHTRIQTYRLDALENPRLASLITVGADAEVDFLLSLCNTDSRIQQKEEIPDWHAVTARPAPPRLQPGIRQL